MDEERKLYLPYLLSALSQASFEGELTLIEGDLQRIIFFRSGKPVNVISRLQEETLGRILVEEGKISPGDYNQLLNQLVKTRKPAGELLISMGLLGPQDVFLALEFQTCRKLLNCFRMADFGFSLEQKPVPAEQLIANLEVEEVIFTGIQSAYSVDRLLTEFPVDEETVFQSRNPPRGHPVKMVPRVNKLYRLIETDTRMNQLMSVEGDLQKLLSVLYALHALLLLDASGIPRPSTKDLELPGLEDEQLAAAPPAPDQGEEPGTEASGCGPGQDSFAPPPTLDDVLRANGVSPMLAEKVLALARGDHFTVLEVPREIPAHELKSAFYALLRRYKLQDIDSAYSTAKDRNLARRLLDRATVAYRELENPESRDAYLQALAQHQDLQSREVPPRILADVEAQKGEIACSAKRYQEAIAHYQEAINLYPSEPSYHFQLGLAGYMKALSEIPETQRIPDHVRKPFLKAMAMNPRYDMPRMYLGYISKRNGNLKRALKEFEGVLECNPANARAQSEIRVLKKRLEDKK